MVASLPGTAGALAYTKPRPVFGELGRFYDALHGLEVKTRASHVRVVWLGDSHGASDFWSGALREQLQSRFGDGGPGFIHVANRGYRHEATKTSIGGEWRQRPKGPSTVLPTGDGVFGLSGILMAADSEGPRASVTVTDPGVPAVLNWDVCYKQLTPADEVTLRLTGWSGDTAANSAAVNAASRDAGGSPFRHVMLTSNGAEPTLAIGLARGRPELCGVVVEADPKVQPGVVLDTLGINGARLATPLAWNEDAWVAELRRRAPSLVVLEYGTNESGDFKITPSVYVQNLTKVMGRVHRAAPACDCLVLAPTDRADTADRTPLVRDALRDAAKTVGCAFWDTYETMGGGGSIVKWRGEAPPRAGPDGVHLNYRGYRELGERLAAAILGAY